MVSAHPHDNAGAGELIKDVPSMKRARGSRDDCSGWWKRSRAALPSSTRTEARTATRISRCWQGDRWRKLVRAGRPHESLRMITALQVGERGRCCVAVVG